MKRHRLPFSARLVIHLMRHVQQALESIGSMLKRPFSSIMTILVLSLTLTIPASLHVLIKNTTGITSSWDNAAEISLFLKNNASDTAIANLQTRIKTYPEVASVSYISRDEALKDFKTLSGFGDALSYLDSNPLPAVLNILPSNNYVTSSKARELLTKLEHEPEVNFGRLDIEWLDRLQTILQLFEKAAQVTIFILLLAIIMIIGNTVRLDIVNRRSEIEIMKLVGATESFIQRPFLYSGLFYGIISGLLAWIIVNCSIIYLRSAIVKVFIIYGTKLDITSLGLLELVYTCVFAAILSWLGAYLSVKYYLTKIEPK